MTEGGMTSVTSDGYTATSSSESPEQLAEILKPAAKPDTETPAEESDPERERISKAASELGKEGGKAAAAKRAEAKEQAKAEAEPPPEDETDPEEKLGKPRHDPKARMLEATRQAAEAKRELAQERAEKQRIAQELAELRTPKKAPEPVKPTDSKPKAADYEDYSDYVLAASKSAAEETLKAREQKAASTNQQQRIHDDMIAWENRYLERINKAVEANPDLKGRLPETYQNLGTLSSYAMHLQGRPVQAINAVVDEIMSAENGPEIFAYLETNPTELQRLAALRTPHDVVREVAKLETRFNAAPTATALEAEVSRAKPPVRPVAGSPHTADSTPNESSSYDEYKSWRMRKDREARARR